MASASDKKRWDDLHAAYTQASEVELAYEIELGAKYGHNFQSQWLSKGQKAKLEKLRAAKDKIGDKIVDLLVRVSPRGDTWLSGVPSWWIQSKLTWEDAIRPVGETLSVVVPGAYGSRDGTVKERKVRVMPKNTSKDAKEFREFLEKAVLLVGGESESAIQLDDDPVFVAIMFDVNGYGPHVGAIYAMQNRFHAHADTVLQAADEILEEWTRDHYPPDEDEEDSFTETFDGRTWKMSAEEFAEAIEGTEAAKYIDVEEAEEDEASEVDEGVLEEGSDDEDVPHILISFTRITRGDSEDSDDYEEEHGWIDEEGVEFEPDESDVEDGMSESESIVEQAVKFLQKEGASNPSSSGFHPGVWYSTEYETTDYGTGEEEERSFHLKNFEKEEEAEIFKQMTARRR
jgi:hypothetical protein